MSQQAQNLIHKILDLLIGKNDIIMFGDFFLIPKLCRLNLYLFRIFDHKNS